LKNDLARSLGHRIRDLREGRKLTQAEFAKHAGLSLTFVRRIERGELKNPPLNRLGLIAVALDVTVASLFTVHESYDDMPYDKAILIESIERMLRLHGIAEIRAIKALLREVFIIQRLGRK
jgi:transcriptional regulator with XRE-family HTH domain